MMNPSEPNKPLLRVADYIAQSLVRHGIRDIFMVTGGGAMHLNDAFGRCQGLRYVCCHHEQACAMAAEAYARVTGDIGVINVTTGPGGINALNGVFGAWTDSIPMLVISGQVKRETALFTYNLIGKLRQLGDQEVDIVGMAKGITKYAVTIDDPSSIRYHVERALHLARTGRPGPTWIDVPVDVQGAMIAPDLLKGYDPEEDRIGWETTNLSSACGHILSMLKSAKRPVIFAGSGIRLSGAYEKFLTLIDRLGVPIVTAWNSNDLLWNDHPLFSGRPGSVGDRAGNFAVQNSDVLLVLGCRLNIRLVSYNWKQFAPYAYKIAVDIDPEEMRKPTCRIDFPVHADVADTIHVLLEKSALSPGVTHENWVAWCQERRRRYPVVLPEYWEKNEPVNPYCFMAALFQHLRENEIVVTANGSACVTAFQAAFIKPGQRLFHNSGAASMGFDLPAAIGAAIARPGSRIICIAGDGSIMMNLQELQTITGLHLPVKVFLINNRGYHSIRQTQQSFFPGKVIGCDSESGVTFPDFGKITQAFGFRFIRCETHDALTSSITATLESLDAAFCEVISDPDQPFAPKLSSRRLADGSIISAALEDMAPFISHEELRENMPATQSGPEGPDEQTDENRHSAPPA